MMKRLGRNLKTVGFVCVFFFIFVALQFKDHASNIIFQGSRRGSGQSGSSAYHHKTITLHSTKQTLNTTEDIIRERNNHLREICKQLGMELMPGNISSKIWQNKPILQRPRIYFSDKYKVIVCGVPKAGSTAWRKALLILERDVKATAPDDIEHEFAYSKAWQKRLVWHKFNPSSEEGRREIDRRLNSYYRVMTVREPLERIVSAYIDKLIPGGTGGQSYAARSRNIHRLIGHYPQNNTDRATFEEFVEFLIQSSNAAQMDMHWRPYSGICDPCHMKYHQIANLETFSQDSEFVSKKIGIDRKLLFPDALKTRENDLKVKWKNKYIGYYQNLTAAQVRGVYELYENEYKLFGYPPPPFLEN